MTENVIQKPVLDSVQSFENIINFVDTKLIFRGLSLEQWYNQTKFPEIPVFADKEEILKLNSLVINKSELIYKNTAIAKGALVSAKARHLANIQAYKVNCLEEVEEQIKNGVKKSKPTAEILEAKASVHCKNDQQTVVLAEIVYDFWKYQVDKLQLFNTRLTSMNISLHNDEKYANANT